MIYCIPKPEAIEPIEEVSFRDENNFEWVVTRVDKGMWLEYKGPIYFSPTKFWIELEDREKTITILNLRTFFIKDSSFEAYDELRNLINSEFTDDIWEAIEASLKERLLENELLLNDEIIA